MEGLYKSDHLSRKMDETTKILEINNLLQLKISNFIEMHDFLVGEKCKTNKKNEIREKTNKNINKYVNFELLDINLFVLSVTSASIAIASHHSYKE